MKVIQPLNDPSLIVPEEIPSAHVQPSATQPVPDPHMQVSPDTSKTQPIVPSEAVTTGGKNKGDLTRAIVGFFRGYVIGLVVLFLFGLILGTVFGNAIFASEAVKFSGLESGMRTFLFVLPLTLVFWFIGSGLGNKWVALYPIVAFTIGSAYAVPAGVLFYLPDLFSTVGLQAAIAYMMAHALVWPLTQFARSSKSQRSVYKEQLTIVAILTFIFIGPLIGVAAISTSAIIAKKAVRTMASVPSVNTDAMFTAFSEQANVTDTPQMRLYYRDKILTQAGRVQTSDSIKTTALSKVWLRDSLAGCNEKGELKTTKTGIEYRETVAQKYHSKPERESTKYTTYTYCFAAGYTTFVIERKIDAVGRLVQEKYPIDAVISAFHDADTVNVLCVKNLASRARTADTTICSDEERTKWDAMLELPLQRHQSMPELVTGTPVPKYVPEDAYQRVAWLSIPELGIEIPLSEEIAESTYRKTNYGYEILLNNVLSPSCSRADSAPSGALYSLGYIDAMTVEEVANLSTTPRNGGSYVSAERPVIGDNAYKVSPKVHCKFNAEHAGLTEELINRYSDILIWSTANGRVMGE